MLTVDVLSRFRLDGKVAIVTGASSGLGVAFAEALAEAGADVALGARRVDRLADTAKLVEAHGRRAIAVQTDVSDPEACRALVAATVEQLGRVDVLVTTPVSARRCRRRKRPRISSGRSSTSTCTAPTGWLRQRRRR